ncbi:MAG: hypothetical protein KAU14_08995 [Thermoplasmata archaeon]|nr:hypothetical protein [Thermoplasmata archaeon]
MWGLSGSAWVIMILGILIFYGGSLYCLFLAWGKRPDRLFYRPGVMNVIEYIGEWAKGGGVYKPFEYMEKGPKEKGVAASLVLVLLIIGWQAGVFEEEEEEGEKTFSVTITEETMTFAQESDHCNEDETIEYFYNITQENLLHIRIILTWDDDMPGLINGDNDRFRLEVDFSWENENGDGSGSSGDDSDTGEIIFERDTTIERPEGSEYHEGKSEEKVRTEYTITEIGEYYVNVTCEDAGDRDPTPFGKDDGNDFTLEVILTYYVVHVTETHVPL